MLLLQALPPGVKRASPVRDLISRKDLHHFLDMGAGLSEHERPRHNMESLCRQADSFLSILAHSLARQKPTKA